MAKPPLVTQATTATRELSGAITTPRPRFAEPIVPPVVSSTNSDTYNSRIERFRK